MICVAIGRGRHRHMIAEHRHLVSQGAKLVELRLDYINGQINLKRLTAEQLLDAINLAVKEINAAGGVLGKKLEPIVEDGASDWPTFNEKAKKLSDSKVPLTALRLALVQQPKPARGRRRLA
jgi:hypothetical protein